MRPFAPSCALILLVACAAPPRSVPGSGGIAVEYDLDHSSSRPLEGELATFFVRVRNAGDRSVILRDLVQADGSVLATWQRPMGGQLTFREGADDFLYDPRRQDSAERPVFNTALLAPGEEILFKPRIRLLGLPREFAITYFSCDAADLRRSVYFVKDRDARPMKFARILDDEELRILLAPDPAGAAASHRTVIFPYAESVLSTPKRHPFTLNLALEKRAFTLDEAARRLGVARQEIRAVSWYSGLSSWALRTPAGAFWVGRDGVVTLPPVNDLDLFCFALDSISGDSVGFDLRPGVAQVFAAEVREFPVAVLSEDSRNRYTAYVPRTGLERLFKKVISLNYRIDVSRAEGGFRILLTH